MWFWTSHSVFSSQIYCCNLSNSEMACQAFLNTAVRICSSSHKTLVKFQLIPMLFSGVEVRALCWTSEFFQDKFGKLHIHGLHFVYRGIAGKGNYINGKSWCYSIRKYSVSMSASNLVAFKNNMDVMIRYCTMYSVHTVFIELISNQTVYQLYSYIFLLFLPKSLYLIFTPLKLSPLLNLFYNYIADLFHYFTVAYKP